MTAASPAVTITATMPKGGVSGGGLSRGHRVHGPLDYISHLRGSGIDRAIILARETYAALGDEHLTRSKRRGWWRLVTLPRGADFDFDVKDFAAYLVFEQMENLDSMIHNSRRWLLVSKPICVEEHLHSDRLMHDGTVVCVDTSMSPAAVRRLHYATPTPEPVD